MTPFLATEDWRMTFMFAAAMGLLILVLKVISAVHGRPLHGVRVPFWLTLLPSICSLARVQVAGPRETRRALLRCAWVVAGSAMIYLVCLGVVRASGASGICLGWIGAPLLWLM